MKKSALYILCAAVLSSVPTVSHACSCTFIDTRQAFDDASIVIIGEIETVEHKRTRSGIRPAKEFGFPHTHTEVATIVVKEAWKGAEVGQKIRFASEFQGRAGLCGDSFWGKSALLHSLFKNRPDRPPEKAKTWLIFVNGREPYSLDLCQLFLPLETVDAQEGIKVLNEIEIGRQLSR
jgi:hypothetical protein